MESTNIEIEIIKEKTQPYKEIIGIIGTGNYGIAIGKRLIHYGFKVAYGSRSPNCNYVSECLNIRNNENEKEQLFSVTSIEEACLRSDNVIFLAVSADYEIHEKILNELILSMKSKNNMLETKRKILVDVSNMSDDEKDKKCKVSNAEKFIKHLEAKLSESCVHSSRITVVKGFNMLNAYSMSNYAVKGSIETVPIAGDDIKAKEYIINLCNQIGFQGVDYGCLGNSFELELSNKSTFDEWAYPSLICIVFVFVNFVWSFFWYYLFPKKHKPFSKFLEEFSLMSHLNKVLGFSALQLLAFVYLGSVMAGVYQLIYGTKYKLFPKYLDFWLKARKQFGLWAFLIASSHVFMTIFITNPSYLGDWYQKIDNTTSGNAFGLTHMTLHGEINVLTGISAYIIMTLIALSSINSIANSLNWSEWRFVQSGLGILCLVMCFLHDFSMYLRIFLTRRSYGTVYLVTRIKLIGLYFPLIVLLLRFIFAYFPPISIKINRVRNGMKI